MSSQWKTCATQAALIKPYMVKACLFLYGDCVCRSCCRDATVTTSSSTPKHWQSLTHIKSRVDKTLFVTNTILTLSTGLAIANKVEWFSLHCFSSVLTLWTVNAAVFLILIFTWILTLFVCCLPQYFACYDLIADLPLLLVLLFNKHIWIWIPVPLSPRHSLSVYSYLCEDQC